jgi:glucose/mannose-6-phosphate isomerase
LSILDESGVWPVLDPQGMYGLIESFPGQFRSAAKAADEIQLSLEGPFSSIVISGVGGSAIGGDIVRSMAGKSLKLPYAVCRDYSIPGYLSPSSLVIACSYSGNTEETMAFYQSARQAGSPIICIASGGRLAQLAATDGVDAVTVPGGLPPRAALGFSSLALLGCLVKIGVLPGFGADLEETADLLSTLALRYGSKADPKSNAAMNIALSLHGRIAAIYAASGLLEAAAARWRGQIEENAKNLAFHHLLPEMNHNEILGWECPEEALSGLGAIFLRDQEDHPQVQRRFDLTMGLVARRAGIVHEIWSEGNSRLARLFSVLYLSDFVSYYLGLLNGVDPVKIDAIDFLKRELGR